MKLKIIREVGAIVGESVGLSKHDAAIAGERAMQLASIEKNVAKPQLFADYVNAELTKRGVKGRLGITVLSAAKGNKEVRQVFEPLEYIANQGAIKVIVQYDGPHQAFYVLIDPVDMGCEEVCGLLGIEPPKQSVEDEKDFSTTSLKELCPDCNQLWRRDVPQLTIVAHFLTGVEGEFCPGDEFDIYLEIAYEHLRKRRDLGPECRHVARKVLLETHVFMEDEKGNIWLDTKGRKWALTMIRDALAATEKSKDDSRYHGLRQVINDKRNLIALEQEKQELTVKLERAKRELEQAHQTVQRCEREAYSCQAALDELEGKLETAKQADLDPSTHPLLRHLNPTQVASLWK